MNLKLALIQIEWDTTILRLLEAYNNLNNL